jgi:hypothetical protein
MYQVTVMTSLWPDDTSPDDSAPDAVARLDPKYRPAWAAYAPAEQAALAQYFLPHHSKQAVLGPTRPRVVKWYCPFACQNTFPSGHRYCVNVYTGCAHQCTYCYAAAYEPGQCGIKRDFPKLIEKDMADLERFDVPAAPIHMSNSTDAFQPLEETTGHTRYALEQIRAHRKRFTTITLLTKNPLLAAEPRYLTLLQALRDLPDDHPRHAEFRRPQHPGLIVEVSLAFWRDDVRSFYEPGAPTIAQRIDGLRALQAAGIPLILRVDPLFPRSPLPGTANKSLGDFGLPEAQTIDDLKRLVDLARQLDAQRVVFSVAKIICPRHGGQPYPMQAMRAVYAACAAPARPPFRSGSWRFPPDLADQHIVQPFLDLCRQAGVPARYCMHHLLDTR